MFNVLTLSSENENVIIMKRTRTWFRFLFYLITFLIVAQIGVIYKWNWLCTNFQPHRHVYEMCNLYQKGVADGTLCSPLCDTKEIFSLTCYTQYTNKDVVFGGTWGNTEVVFKSAISDVPALHWYDNGVLKYPSEKQFLSTLRAVTRDMLNYSLSNDILTKLAHLRPKQEDLVLTERHAEMDNIWVLIQDNEFLLTNVYSNRDIFPQILGTCGSYFAVEYVKPLSDSFSILYEMDTKENWERNLKYSVLLMELIEELENNFKEPLHLCDVKIRDFGITAAENGRVKILDIDAVYPKSVISRYIKNINRCSGDEDCKFMDCRGRCNLKERTCERTVSNNNLQLICEKIFLGWRMSNRILLPGLLLSRFAPDELMAVLRQCANPENEANQIPRAAANEDIRKRLYTILADIEQTMNTDAFP